MKGSHILLFQAWAKMRIGQVLIRLSSIPLGWIHFVSKLAPELNNDGSALSWTIMLATIP